MHLPRALPFAAFVLSFGVWAQSDVLGDARRLAGTGQPKPALELVERALQARPRDAELRFLRGVLLSDLGQDDNALAVFRELNQEYPELPDPLNNLAVLHAARGELERARELLEAALRNQPRHLTARENLGDVYLRLALGAWEAVEREARPEPALARKLELARALDAAISLRR